MAKRSYRKKIYVDKLSLGMLMLSLVLVTALITFTITRYMLTRQTRQELEEEEMIESTLEVNRYYFDNLKWNDYFVKYEDDNYTSVQGIDVSAHQQEIDWAKVKEQGIDFAFIRVGYRGYEYGLINKDIYFDYNMQQAIANDIKVGVYFFSQAISVDEAREEVDFVLDSIKDYKIDLPVVFDMEEEGPEGIGRVKVLTPEEKTKIGVTWLHRVRNAGYDPMIYGSTLTLPYLYNLEYTQEFYCWVAEYSSECRYPYLYQIWQYTSSAEIDGIPGVVDMDILMIPKGETLWGFEGK